MNHSWRADVIQEGMLLALDSEVESQPKATKAYHLLSDSWNLLFFSPMKGVISGEAARPAKCSCPAFWQL